MARGKWIAMAAWVCLAACAYGDTAVKEMTAASNAFLGALTPEQRATAVFEFNSEERLNWHYVPKDRIGISYAQLMPEQRELGIKLLRSGLSEDGFAKVEGIRNLEHVLREIENSATRDSEKYYFTFFGEPSETGTWAFRYEGHHLSMHWTAVEGKIVATFPQFMGTNPAEVRQGPGAGTRVLAQEEDLGRALVHALTEAQRAEAVLHPEAPPEILTGAQREAAIQEDRGVAYSALNAEQQGMLISLIQMYANSIRPDLAEERLNKVRAAGLETIKFAWMGGLEKGEKHYYRIQGTTFIIEYDNTQNDANHVHTVWRDFKGDFGQDILKQHYEQHADPAHPGEHKH